jgi:triphosphoribosyl-dephospho-CoA synthase
MPSKSTRAPWAGKSDPAASSTRGQLMEPSLGQCAQLACVWEATARKAGNVHPGRDFADLRFADFLASAAAIAPVFENAGRQAVGQTVLGAIQATRAVVATNTNLGIVLLLAPLAAVVPSQSLEQGVLTVLDALDVEDARRVFAAIRLARPGGLGKASEQDVHAEPTLPLRAVMALAAGRDLVARQYASGYRETFEVGLPALELGLKRFANLEEAVVFTHLKFLARFPDSLIARKRGPEEAELASRRAREVLDADWPRSAAGRAAFADFDRWLTSDGNTRNPGTSADLVTACLFAALRDKKIAPTMPIGD